MEITAIEPESNGVFIGTRNGVWHRSHDGVLKQIARVNRLADPEVQALCFTNEGLWVGTRTGLYCATGPNE